MIKFIRDEQGATAIEYGLIASLIAVATDSNPATAHSSAILNVIALSLVSPTHNL